MINLFSKLIPFTRIQNASCSGIKKISTQAFPLQFKASPVLWAEPLKKKKKLDPNIAKAREERKKKKIMKEIKKLQKLSKQFKPIAEFQIPQCLVEELEQRKREIKVPEEVVEKRILLLKQWASYKFKEAESDIATLKRLMKAQQQALEELRCESEELYQAAVKIDENLIPLKFTGPQETPPKGDYFIPDGAYIDVSKKWDEKLSE